MKESGFKQLRIWQQGMEIAKAAYALTRYFPNEEIYGLISQRRRAAISVPSNIAEGYSRKNIKEFKQFLYIALGSLGELETQLLLSKEFGYLNNETAIFKLLHYERSMILKMCRSS